MAKESRMQEYTIDIGPYNVRNVHVAECTQVRMAEVERQEFQNKGFAQTRGEVASTNSEVRFLYSMGKRSAEIRSMCTRNVTSADN